MSDYIKRGNVEHGVGYVGIDKDYFVSVKKVLNITAETGALETQCRVRDLPPADVVEVVRCKKCKYRIDGNCYVSNFIAGLPCMIRYVGEDDYCSYGKPKEQESE